MSINLLQSCLLRLRGIQSTSMSFFQSDADACHDADRRKDRFEGQHHREKLPYIWKLRSCMPWAWVTAYSRGESTSVTTTRVVPSVDSEISESASHAAEPQMARPPSSFIYHLSPHPPHPNPHLHFFIWCGTTSMSLEFRCKQESTLPVLALSPNTVVASLVQRFLYQLVGRI